MSCKGASSRVGPCAAATAVFALRIVSKPNVPNATTPTANHFFMSPPEGDFSATSFFLIDFKRAGGLFRTAVRTPESRHPRCRERARRRSTDSVQATKTTCPHLISLVCSRSFRSDPDLSVDRRKYSQRPDRGHRKRRPVCAQHRNRRRPCLRPWADSQPPCRFGNPSRSFAEGCAFR